VRRGSIWCGWRGERVIDHCCSRAMLPAPWYPWWCTAAAQRPDRRRTWNLMDGHDSCDLKLSATFIITWYLMPFCLLVICVIEWAFLAIGAASALNYILKLSPTLHFYSSFEWDI
jgi:hypothetical protein